LPGVEAEEIQQGQSRRCKNRRAALAGVVQAGEGELGFTGRLDGRGGTLPRCSLGVGSSSGGQPQQGWLAAGRGRAAAAHRLRAGRRRIACVQVCVRGEEERKERWRGSGGVDQAKAGRPGRSGPRWAGQASWASAYWPVNLSPALGEKKKIFI
jgi:hypothetical protein